jgi:hypothetical protein
MFSKTNVMKILFGFFALILLGLPQLSYADTSWSVGVSMGDRDHHDDAWRHHEWEEHHHHDWEEHHYEWRYHPYWGYRMHFLPPGGYVVWVDGVRYYYCDGLYYTYAPDGEYIVVNPPIGAYVSAIPPDFQAVFVNGRTYYTNDGVYYVLTHHGYRVVAPPVMYAQPQAVVYSQPEPPQAAPPVAAGADSFTVNVPNNSGGYTTVVIKKSGNGYVGPQGEFYAAFPTIAQLKAMYVK